MTKTFCDRCGKEIERKSGFGGLYAWITHRTYFAKLRMIQSSVPDDVRWKEDERYICPECEASYIHWFMNPEKDGDPNDKS